ncbi:type II toxin-antitoxin system VapC family toxin [Methanoregula sp.]|uniref:type II toxin-antitoxin system VapC family toxin n=1 Tax=Methanoregula sp. TaxID=2052170 RepID=UPI0026307CE7|nr:type II toxin-antitoxin system VapC family toxin [Methanoregula sp.]MDD5144424.1 type II toxin-antitoxin system VapC family toxin [Methanoregula sp.]
MNFFLDTSICVDVLRTKGAERSLELFESFSNKNAGFVSVITVAELSAGAALSPLGDAMNKTESLLSYVGIIDLTEPIAFESGKIFAGLSKAGKKIEFNDCLIAATARSMGTDEIVTRNCDHFNRIPGIRAVIPENIEF